MKDREYEALVDEVVPVGDFNFQVAQAMVEIKAGLYTAFGEVISDYHDMDADVVVDAMGRMEFGLAWLRNLMWGRGGVTRSEVLRRSAEKIVERTTKSA